jgi:formate hydrogenlyase subunit 6/NADH:ubiquinone oxidoreductase subunit I
MIFDKFNYIPYSRLRTYIAPVFIYCFKRLTTFNKLDSSPIIPLKNPFKGEVELVRNESGDLLCNSCSLCLEVCPVDCLNIELQDGHAPLKFEIDTFTCIYCGFCEEICPEGAIALSEKFPSPSFRN